MVQTQPKNVAPIKTAMILAAGRGKRLRPLTDALPKPLVEVKGKPLIVWHLEALKQAGIEKVVINYAWLGEKIPQALGSGQRFGLEIVYSPEPEGGLETAGGIIQALPLLGETPFIVVNGDVWTDFDFSQLHSVDVNTVLGHLVLVPSPRFKVQGDFGLANNGRATESGPWTFAGVSVLSPQLLVTESVGFKPLAPILRKAMAQNKITGQIHQGIWSDIGTPERLAEANAQLSKGVEA